MRVRSLLVTLYVFAFLGLLGVAQAQEPAFYLFQGNESGDGFGRSVAGAGDVNNDGFDDLIVGARANDHIAPNAGEARVLSGVDGSVLYDWYGFSAQDQFGFSVSGAGDINQDGYDDVIVGSPFADIFGADSGSASILSGRTGWFLYTFTGDSASDFCGYSVSGAGDVNQDGYADVIIGLPFDDPGGLTNSGSARVHSGYDGTILYTFNGFQAWDQLGYSVSGAGDVNQDGYDDVIVGVPFYDVSDAGRAIVYSGQSGLAIHDFFGGAAGDSLGYCVSGAGDIYGDGYDDVIVGIPFADSNGLDAGTAIVYSGRNGLPTHTRHGANAGDQLGFSVDGAGDTNFDFYGDFIVGARKFDGGATDQGTALLISGENQSVLQQFYGVIDGYELGYSVSGAGDINQDGRNDVIVGLPLGGSGTGTAVVYSGTCGTADPYGSGCPGSGAKTPYLFFGGCVARGGPTLLAVTNGLGGSSAFLFLGTDQAAIPMGGGCTLNVTPLLPWAIGPVPLTGSGPGLGTILAPVTIPVLLSGTFTMQAFVIDPGVPRGYSNSNGFEFRVF